MLTLSPALLTSLRIPWVAHAQGHLPNRVAELVEPFLDDEAWRTRFLFLLQQADLGAGRRFFDLFLHCIEKGWLDETKEALASNHSLFWTLLFALPTQRPEWACEAIGRYFDRCLNRSILLGERHPFDHRLNIVPHTFHGNNTLMESATHAPLAFYEQVSDFMYMVMGLNVRREGDPPWQDNVWGRMHRHSGGEHGANALLSAMERALSCVAADHPEKFEPIALLLQALDFETAHYLLLRGYTTNGARFADAAAEHLCKHTTDLAIGYGGDAHGVTRELIEAITPYCSKQAFVHLERRLLNYYTAYERSAKSYKTRVYFGQPTLFGHPQLELLEAVAPSHRTQAIERRIAEWRRKFPDTARRSSQSHQTIFTASRIGSPISRGATAKMTDQQWLRAITRHHQDHPHMHRDGTLVGGVFHIASQLESLVMEQPHRFTTLVQVFPDDTHPSYFNAVLRGIAEAPLDGQTVLDVCRRCHSLPDRPCGHGICTVIAKKAELSLPPEALDIVAWYATEGVQSDQGGWRDSLDESLDRHTDPITVAGSISVRGNAAEAMALLIYSDGERIPFFLPTLSRMVRDEAIPVRACVARALRAVLKYDREIALSLFSQLCETEDFLLQTSSVEHFIAPALHTHFGAIEPLLQRMLQSTVPGVTRVGARLACVASLITEQARPLAERCLSGSEAQRMGAAEILTLHLRLAPFRTFCEQALIQLFNDPAEKVRERTATCFNEFEGGQLSEYRELIEAFVQSRTFVTNPYYFIHALENTSAKLPEITCLACETLFETMCKRNFNGYAHVRPDTVGKLLLRVYSQQRDKALQRRCLNLIDCMLQFGEYSLSQVLAEYER